jgi:hypothetical protein
LSDDRQGRRWPGWGKFVTTLCFLGPPLYVIIDRHGFSNDSSRRIGILLEIASFVFVTPEFLGPERLSSLDTRAKQILSGPLASFEKYKKALGEEGYDFDDLGLYLFLGVVTLLFFIVITVLSLILYELWPLLILPFLFTLLLFLFGLFSFVKNVFGISAYLATAGLNRFLSWSLGALAERERLRLWIFWLGADFFLVSKLLALYEVHK